VAERLLSAVGVVALAVDTPKSAGTSSSVEIGGRCDDGASALKYRFMSRRATGKETTFDNLSSACVEVETSKLSTNANHTNWFIWHNSISNTFRVQHLHSSLTPLPLRFNTRPIRRNKTSGSFQNTVVTVAEPVVQRIRCEVRLHPIDAINMYNVPD